MNLTPVRAFMLTISAAGMMIIAGLIANNTVVISCEAHETQQICAARAARLVSR